MAKVTEQDCSDSDDDVLYSINSDLSSIYSDPTEQDSDNSESDLSSEEVDDEISLSIDVYQSDEENEPPTKKLREVRSSVTDVTRYDNFNHWPLFISALIDGQSKTKHNIFIFIYMFRLITTRIISTSRIIIKSPGCLSYPPRRFLPNSISPSNEDVTTSATPLVDRNNNETSSRTNKSPVIPKIYTRRGDRGTSTLLSSGANRLSKDSLIFDVLGTIDELSSTIGIVISSCPFPQILKQLENIQCALFEIGSCVAAENCSSRFEFNDAILIKHLEEDIDRMTAELPELRNFILPGGSSKIASHVHFSRAVCRRCERLLTKWVNNKIQENQSQQETIMGIYLNRLSDYLFTLGRYVAHKDGHKEIIYHKSK
ncbi:unnamed protein product [Rotaria magnacalcarata]|uniref:Cobalamin adenosyltransferase-like domain-containing protein n=3 Tax=Rotaria magnacalcarata TaxID=392030 RepID=A0A819QDK9_9BILA|nr:unnamed protein product [Rotaria magnacalcarata]CAF3834247.1 unnamed protein product [Rotaria magnacalcarata]CAF4026827.1 unnamed protein product [Rotaria magnacalcarata]